MEETMTPAYIVRVSYVACTASSLSLSPVLHCRAMTGLLFYFLLLYRFFADVNINDSER